MVLIREGSEVHPPRAEPELAIAGVGTFAEIREASKYSDGRWDLVAVGTARFMVVEVDTEIEPYLVAEVDPYPDDPGDLDDDAAEELVGRVARRFVDYLRLLEARRQVGAADRRPGGGRDGGAPGRRRGRRGRRGRRVPATSAGRDQRSGDAPADEPDGRGVMDHPDGVR